MTADARVLVVLLVAVQAHAERRTGSAPPDDLLSKWTSGQRPGIAVALMQGGQVRYERTLGYADLESRTPMRKDTRFPVGSISKQFTATAILLLARDRKLHLDDTASRFVPDLPEYARGITIRQLLHHTGGLPDHEELLAGRIDREFFMSASASHRPPYLPGEAFAALRTAGGLRFPPGEKWEYSNTGYFVLGQVIEHVCHCTYSHFLKGRIFEPLGMKHSLIIPLPPVKVAKLASAYARSQREWVNISYSPLNFIVGHDGVVSTLQDMTRWIRAIANGPLLTVAERSAMFETGFTNDASPIRYGFGWKLAELEGARVFQHEGCWSGFRNGIVLSPGAGFSAIVLTNANDADEFWNCEDSLNLARDLVRQAGKAGH